MKFLNRDIQAVIFDMDGTLIDSTGLWHEIDKKFFAKRNMDLPKDYAQKIVHLGLKQAANFTKKEYGIKETPEEIIQEWRQMAIDFYVNEVQLKDGALELLNLFKSNDLKLAIATANDAELYMPCVNRLGIGSYFDFIDDVNISQKGKEDGKIYLDLVDKLQTKVENTLVLEDMPTCLKTVHEIGFPTIAVFDKASEKYEEDKRSNSDLFINNFNELIKLLKGELYE